MRASRGARESPEASGVDRTNRVGEIVGAQCRTSRMKASTHVIMDLLVRPEGTRAAREKLPTLRPEPGTSL